MSSQKDAPRKKRRKSGCLSNFTSRIKDSTFSYDLDTLPDLDKDDDGATSTTDPPVPVIKLRKCKSMGFASVKSPPEGQDSKLFEKLKTSEAKPVDINPLAEWNSLKKFLNYRGADCSSGKEGLAVSDGLVSQNSSDNKQSLNSKSHKPKSAGACTSKASFSAKRNVGVNHRYQPFCDYNSAKVGDDVVVLSHCNTKNTRTDVNKQVCVKKEPLETHRKSNSTLHVSNNDGVCTISSDSDPDDFLSDCTLSPIKKGTKCVVDDEVIVISSDSDSETEGLPNPQPRQEFPQHFQATIAVKVEPSPGVKLQAECVLSGTLTLSNPGGCSEPESKKQTICVTADGSKQENESKNRYHSNIPVDSASCSGDNLKQNACELRTDCGLLANGSTQESESKDGCHGNIPEESASCSGDNQKKNSCEQLLMANKEKETMEPGCSSMYRSLLSSPPQHLLFKRDQSGQCEPEVFSSAKSNLIEASCEEEDSHFVQQGLNLVMDFTNGRYKPPANLVETVCDILLRGNSTTEVFTAYRTLVHVLTHHPLQDSVAISWEMMETLFRHLLLEQMTSSRYLGHCLCLKYLVSVLEAQVLLRENLKQSSAWKLLSPESNYNHVKRLIEWLFRILVSEDLLCNETGADDANLLRLVVRLLEIAIVSSVNPFAASLRIATDIGDRLRSSMPQQRKLLLSLPTSPLLKLNLTLIILDIRLTQMQGLPTLSSLTDALCSHCSDREVADDSVSVITCCLTSYFHTVKDELHLPVAKWRCSKREVGPVHLSATEKESLATLHQLITNNFKGLEAEPCLLMLDCLMETGFL